MTLFMGVVAVLTWEAIWYWTMEGPDPLTQNVIYAWKVVQRKGGPAPKEVIATVRGSFEHVWKHGLGSGKIEL